MLSNQAQNYRISKSTPLRYGNAPPNVVPYQSFKTTNGHVILAIGNDRQFRKFCEAANAPSLPDDARFNTCAARVLNREELVPLLSELMERKSTEYWCEILEPIGVPCGPINPVDQNFESPQVQHRQLKPEMEQPLAGRVELVAIPIRYENNPIQYHNPPPLLGQHTDEILSDLLGIGEEQLKSMRESGII